MLDMNGNHIGDEGGRAILTASTKFVELDLTGCGLTDAALVGSMDHLFRSNSNLTRLDLLGNKLTAIPIEAVKAHRPEIQLNLKDNDAMVFPPRLIAEEGPEAVDKFFAELRDRCVPMSSVNVFLVGDGGVGKTTLKVKALLGREPLRTGEWLDSIVGAVLRFGVYFLLRSFAFVQIWAVGV